MSATLAASTAILKTHYPKGELPKELYDNQVALAMVNKTTDFDGQNEVLAIQTEGTQGASADFATALGTLQQSQFYRFTITRAKDYSLARIQGEALKAAEKNTGSLVDLWTNEIESATFTAARSLGISMFRDGTGTRGFVGAYTATQTTLTLKTISDVTNFSVKQFIQAVATSGGTLRAGGAKGQITAIDRVNGILTAGSAWDTLIPGIAANDALVRAGDNNSVLTGFAGWISGSTSTLFGLDRTPDPLKLAGQVLDATRMPMGDALIEAAARVGVEGGKPTHLFCHPRDAANFKKQLDGKVQFDRVESSVAGISFSAMEFEGDNGRVKIMSDMNCQRNIGWLGQLSDVELRSLGPAPHILNYDSNDFLRVASDDAYEVRVGSYAQLKVKRPAHWVQIQNWGT